MEYIRELLHDVRSAWGHYRWLRKHLRHGVNPDQAF